MRQKQQAKTIDEEIEEAWASVCAELIGRTKDPKRKAELAALYRGIDRNFVKGGVAEVMKANAREWAAAPDWMRSLKERRS